MKKLKTRWNKKMIEETQKKIEMLGDRINQNIINLEVYHRTEELQISIDENKTKIWNLTKIVEDKLLMEDSCR